MIWHDLTPCIVKYDINNTIFSICIRMVWYHIHFSYNISSKLNIIKQTCYLVSFLLYTCIIVSESCPRFFSCWVILKKTDSWTVTSVVLRLWAWRKPLAGRQWPRILYFFAVGTGFGVRNDDHLYFILMPPKWFISQLYQHLGCWCLSHTSDQEKTI